MNKNQKKQEAKKVNIRINKIRKFCTNHAELFNNLLSSLPEIAPNFGSFHILKTTSYSFLCLPLEVTSHEKILK